MGEWIKQKIRGVSPGNDIMDNIISSTQWTYLQFVPGHVETCITNINNETSSGVERNINAIIARKHINGTDKTKNKAIDILKNDKIYYPLLRGISDTPTQGDQVLLCEIAGVPYYLGPLNTINSPNVNPDNLMKSDRAKNTKDAYDMFDINPAMVWNTGVKRLQKTSRPMLEAVNINKKNIKKIGNIENYGVGDLMLEGRFGNSIRLGSRGTDPNIIISNGRLANQYEETLNDNCLISMSGRGKLLDHFGTQFIPSADKNAEKPLMTFNDDYFSQTLIRSNKIVIDSRYKEILLSSFDDINLTSNVNINLFSRNATIIESKNIYLGKKIFDMETNAPNLERGEPLVMGETLVKILEELIDAIGNIFVGGTVGGTSIPVNASASPGWNMLDNQIKSKLQDIKSFYHFIEKNDEAEKEL